MNAEAELAVPSGSRPDLSAYLTRQLLDLIRRADLQPGDRLPAAKALAERFGVATPTLREALRRLQATGVIDIRHGSGIYVRRGHERLMLANPGSGALGGETLLDLLDARLLIEPHVAALAAHQAREPEIDGLEQLLRQAERHLIGNDKLLSETNMAFHAAIARASGNLILAQAMESLIELYTSEQLAILSLYNARDRDHHEHLAILDAIRAGDPDEAGERMRRHLAGVKSVVAARLAERGPEPPAAT